MLWASPPWCEDLARPFPLVAGRLLWRREAAARHRKRPVAADPAVMAARRALLDDALPPSVRANAALGPGVAAALWGPERVGDATLSPGQAVWVDRERALFGAWYELFPRSLGGFKGTAARVPELARLGFDVLYLPPIHPIGRTARKGVNNSLQAGDD